MQRAGSAVRGAVWGASLILSVSHALAAQSTPSCPSCADGAALVKRFELPESATPVRARPDWSPPKKIVTTGGQEWIALLRTVAPGAEVIGVANSRAAVAALPGADIYIGFCSPEILAAGKGLRWIQLTSAGADRCAPLIAESGREILLTNAQGLLGPNVADHALALLLTLTRRLHVYHEQQRVGSWSEDPVDLRGDAGTATWELEGKGLLVVGLGGIGTEIARRGHAFGMRVRATRSSTREGPDYVEYVGLADEAVTLARWADVVVNAAPLTPATRAMFDSAFFAAMKPTAYFINVGRGESVVTEDLVAALRGDRIAGAGLDVTAPEPLPPGHPLWSMPAVVLTPHSAGASDQIRRRLLVLAAENLRRYVGGERMLSVVDPRRGY